MAYLEHLIRQPEVHRFGLTLLHFLWQGAVVAIALAFVLWWLRAAGANSRYVAALIGLILMAGMPVATFFVVKSPEVVGDVRFRADARDEPEAPSARGNVLPTWKAEGEGTGGRSDVPSLVPATDAASDSGDAVLNGGAGVFVEPITAAPPASTTLIQRLQPLSPWMALAWAVGVLLLSLRLVGGWFHVARLAHCHTRTVEKSIERMIGRLCQRLGIRRAVGVLESAMVSVPSVVGVLRPVVLLPASALTGLSPEQLESLLAHELAHIRRHDYLVNLLQTLVETLLFYHPAVWWVSGQIRIERENCCDDVAIEVAGSRLLYARALADIADFSSREESLAAASDGGSLPQRIRRVMGISSDTPDRSSSWWVGAVLLLIFTSCTISLSVGSVMHTAQADIVGRTTPQTDINNLRARNALGGEHEFPVFDGFEGGFELNWEPVRPDLTHVSLTKNPGKLTITTQCGSICGDETNRAAKTPARNLYLIRDPAAAGGDFAVTTCIESFKPTVPYQQAGIILYDDDDNFVKGVIECDLSGMVLNSAWETERDVEFKRHRLQSYPNRLWLRIMKHGRYYEFSYSADGERFVAASEGEWDTDAPKWIGLIATNGNVSDEADMPNSHRFQPTPIDAVFDFFEIRRLNDAEANDPSIAEKRKLQGMWEVISSSLDGNVLENRSPGRFTFDGSSMTIGNGSNSARPGLRWAIGEGRLHLDPTREPKRIVLSRSFRAGMPPVQGIYAVDGDALVLCLAANPGVAIPTEFETTEGDGRILIRFQRIPETVVAAIRRNERPRVQYFEMLDRDRNGQLAIGEFLRDYPTPEMKTQGTEVFRLLDSNADKALSLDEFRAQSPAVAFRRMDLDADGKLSESEFANGEMIGASGVMARRAFELTDRDADGFVSEKERTARPPEAWFIKQDTDEDGLLSYQEYSAFGAQAALVRTNRCEIAFAAIDRDSNGRVSREEFAAPPPMISFLKRDLDADEQLSLKEFLGANRTPEQIKAATAVFERKDRDGDGRLSSSEFLAGQNNG